jgi:hypothetical protein
MEHVTASTSYVGTQPLLNNHISLMHGWVPMTVQVVTAIALALANAYGLSTDPHRHPPVAEAPRIRRGRHPSLYSYAWIASR